MLDKRKLEERKNRRNQLYMGLFIIIIMVASTIGFFYGTQEQNDRLFYNEYKFIQKNQKWTTKINNVEYDFYFHPTEVEFYEVSDEVINLFKGKNAFVFTFEHNSSDIQFVEAGRFEMQNNLGKKNIYVISGVLEENTIYKLPVIDCINATAQIPVLKVITADEPKFVVQDNCAILSGYGKDKLARIENLQYRLLDVIK